MVFTYTKEWVDQNWFDYPGYLLKKVFVKYTTSLVTFLLYLNIFPLAVPY